jgi:hypothetical protein
MLDITQYLIANPLVGIGLGILVLLCIYNVLRRQMRVAVGIWLVVLAVLFYVHRQAAQAYADMPDTDLVQPPGVEAP